jgi:hypothetical protein
MTIPEDWRSLTELTVAIGVPEEDRSKFHRNLQNWQYYSVLPRRYDGMEVPQVDNLGRIDSEPFYPPVFIPMLDHLNKLREQYPKDMDEWRCRLWLDGYPAPYIEWCRELLCSWMNAYTVAAWADLSPTGSSPDDGRIVEDTGQVALWDGVQWTDGKNRLRDVVTRRPKRSDPRQSFYRRLTWKLWFPLMEWAVQVGLGQRIQESVHGPISPPRDALAKLLASMIEASSVRDSLAGSGIEDRRIRTLVEVVDNHSTSERERVRMDLLAFSRAGELHNLVGFILSRMWKWHGVRALLVPGLILLRRSPDHQGDLATALGLSVKN